MIKITFPDGSVREYEAGVTGYQIAESISSRLAQDVVACGVNGETVELNRPINEDAKVVLYKFDDEEGKHAFWHTSAHLLAEALQELYPGIQFGFGPAVENGFFYDVLLPNGEMIKEGDFKQWSFAHILPMVFTLAVIFAPAAGAVSVTLAALLL